jgi:hypothetical protein
LLAKLENLTTFSEGTAILQKDLNFASMHCPPHPVMMGLYLTSEGLFICLVGRVRTAGVRSGDQRDLLWPRGGGMERMAVYPKLAFVIGLGGPLMGTEGRLKSSR